MDPSRLLLDSHGDNCRSICNAGYFDDAGEEVSDPRLFLRVFFLSSGDFENTVRSTPAGFLFCVNFGGFTWPERLGRIQEIQAARYNRFTAQRTPPKFCSLVHRCCTCQFPPPYFFRSVSWLLASSSNFCLRFRRPLVTRLCVLLPVHMRYVNFPSWFTWDLLRGRRTLLLRGCWPH